VAANGHSGKHSLHQRPENFHGTRGTKTSAQRLKRVFNIDIVTCGAGGGAVKVIVCIEDPLIIEKILTQMSFLTAYNSYFLKILKSDPFLFQINL
jgi:hypothetical protein